MKESKFFEEVRAEGGAEGRLEEQRAAIRKGISWLPMS